MKRSILFIAIIIAGQSFRAMADSVILKKGHYELKGFIVDNFCDRIVISTFKGEKVVKKYEIESLTFDDKDRDFVFKAQELLEEDELNEKRLDTARNLFQDALTINSNNQEAESGLSRVIDEKIKLKNPAVGFLGMTLASEGDLVKVTNITPRSPAGMSGIKAGDIFFSIWDKKIRFDEVTSIVKLLSGPPETSISIAIEREIPIGYRSKASHNLKGALLLTNKGIFPRFNEIEGGLPADKVVSICGDNTRFITKDYLSWLSDEYRDKNIVITIRRVFNLKRSSLTLEGDINE